MSAPALARSPGLLVAAIVIVGLATPRVASAQEAIRPVTYRVKQGDTLELIAAEFYGDRNKAMFIAAENKLTRPRSLKPGERLRIPVSREVTSAPGDTFESLAMTYLGSARRGGFLADWSGIAQDVSLPAGTPIMIPFTITYTAQSPETLGEVARAYLGDGRQGELLRRYNQLEKSTLDRGESLLVPAFQIRISPARQPALDAESRGRRDHRREAVARAARALPAARLAWKSGDFAEVKAVVAPLEADLDYLDADEAVELAVLLGAAHVAFDADDLAVTAFKRAIDRRATHALRRYDCSPKVLAVWQKAGGTIE